MAHSGTEGAKRHRRRREVCERYGFSDQTLRRRVKDGDFPAGIKISPRIEVWPDEVLDGFDRARAGQ